MGKLACDYRLLRKKGLTILVPRVPAELTAAIDG